jgi:hypothetical protein
VVITKSGELKGFKARRDGVASVAPDSWLPIVKESFNVRTQEWSSVSEE